MDVKNENFERSGPGGIRTRFILAVATGLVLILLLCPRSVDAEEPAEDSATNESADMVDAGEVPEEEDQISEAEEEAQPDESAEPDGTEESAGDSVEETDEALDTEEEVAPDVFLTPEIFGDLRLRWRSRTRSRETDQDMVFSLGLGGRDLLDGHLYFDFAADAYADLFGNQDRSVSTSNEFRGVFDSYNGDLQGRLYEASIGLQQGPKDGFYLEAGRVAHSLDRQYTFDGGLLGIRLMRALEFEAFGGVPVRFFDSDRSGDYMIGGDVRFKTGNFGKGLTSFVHVREGDPQPFAGGTKIDDTDNRFSAEYLYKIFDELRVFGGYSYRGENSEYIRARISGEVNAIDLDYSLRVTTLLTAQEGADSAFAPFSEVLAKLEPNTMVSANVGWYATEVLFFEVGTSTRQLHDDGAESAFNREWWKYYGLLNVDDLVAPGSHVLIRGEYWRGKTTGSQTSSNPLNQERGIVEGEVGYEEDYIEGYIGADYSMWTEVQTSISSVTFLESEREDHWSIYSNIEIHDLFGSFEGFDLEARYTYETGGNGSYHEVRLQVQYEF
ncbi:MAG: hypothetical protein NUW37_02420 [Planctomycetes bacterium]|nr:hypothetical protein [Planctomycetota bacterium]